MLGELTKQLQQSQSLDLQQVKTAVEQLLDENVAVETKAEFLTALSKKGETVEEIAAFVEELRKKSIHVELDAELRSREILDVCGTGGDRLDTFNISTTVALIAAAAGVTVAKHGNRAVTSQCGSADVLEAVGIRIELPVERTLECLKKHDFAFFFAPKFHPSFRHLAQARKLCAQRGQRTLFNLLGPLLNPARPTAQLIGVPCPEFCEPMARVLQRLGVRRGIVVSGKVGTSNIEHRTSNVEVGKAPTSHLDEFSTLGENFVAEFYQERGMNCSTLSPENFPISPVSLPDLAGGNSKTNAQIIHQIFAGEERGPKRDAVLLNAAAALLAAARVKNLNEGWDLACEIIDTGKARKKLDELIEFSNNAVGS